MSIERPWQKPFDELLEELKARLGGEIKMPRDYGGANGRNPPPDIYNYPMFSTEVEGYKLIVEISEFPVTGASYLESGDNVEYLSLHVNTPIDCDLLIRHEGLIDRFKKRIGVTKEFQTGNEEFDRTYFLYVNPDHDASWLRDSTFRKAIEALEPFDAMRFAPYGIYLSQGIHDKQQLSFSAVEQHAVKLIDLARMLK